MSMITRSLQKVSPALWLLTLIAMLCQSCHNASESYRPKKQELRFNLRSAPLSLDPRKVNDSTSVSIVQLCFEGLARMNPKDSPELATAESVLISDDRLTYLFTLRDAYWSDGVAVTAADFETSWKQRLDPAFPCAAANDLFIIKNAKAAKLGHCSLNEVGVKAINDKQLLLELDHPVPYLLSSLASASFLPTPYHITKENLHWIETNYVSNGPFLLKEQKAQQHIIIAKNPHYWDSDVVQLEQVSFIHIEDESTELNMFENRELDWAGYPLSTLPIDALPSLLGQGVVQFYDIAGTYYYMFNTTQFPFQNINIRKAFSLAINRSEIIDNILLMNQQVATTLTPHLLWSYPPKGFADHNVAKAREAFDLGLKELGITKEQFPKVSLSYNTTTAHHKIAQAIQQQWKAALGVNVNLQNREWKVFLDDLQTGQFQIARLGGIANMEDPLAFLDEFRYLYTGKNHTQWHNPTYTALLETADHESNSKQREALLRSAEEILMNEMPVTPIYFYTGAYLKHPYVKNVHISKLNHLELKWAHVETDD